jgi:multiple sugar transport system ATP-binding protein
MTAFANAAKLPERPAIRPVVSCRGVAKVFSNGTLALQNVDLDIKHHQFVSLLGPSGCGKSTLLRMIAGLEEVSRGEIHIDGARVDSLPPGRRGVAMVFQHYALYPHMTVRDNMAFGLRNIGMPAAEIDRKIGAAARILEMEHLLQRRPAQLSGGQRQRVAIGRAIVKEPKAFLFDEPLSNLDAALRSRTRIELARLHQQVKATMVFVTHDQVEAMTMASRIAIMNQGRIEQIGTPLDVYRRPRTRFVAGFIGTPAMNFLLVRLTGENQGRAVVSLAGGQSVVTQVPVVGLPEGRDLELGVRAEHVHNGGEIAGRAEVVERLGDRTFAYARLPDGALVVYEQPGDSPVAVGDQVALSFEPGHVHLFDAGGKGHHAA